MRNWEKIGGMVFGMLAILIAIWMVGDHFGLDKETWPAWVQAIGAIATIAAAFAINFFQQRDARRQHIVNRGIETKDKLGGILAIAEHAQSLIEQLAQEYMASQEAALEFRQTLYAYFETQISYAERSVLAIPLYEVSSYGVVVAVQALTHAIEHTKRDLAAICTAGGHGFAISFKQHAERFGGHLAEANYAVEAIGHARDNVPMTIL